MKEIICQDCKFVMNTGDCMDDFHFCPKCGSSLLTINKKGVNLTITEIIVGVEVIRSEGGILQLKIDRMPLGKLYEILDERYKKQRGVK